MSEKQTRPYQIEAIEAVWGELLTRSTALAKLPTGSGKTFIISHFLKKALEVAPGLRAAMLMGRIQLVEQTERALAEVLPRRSLGVFCGSLGRKELSKPVTIASVQSIADIDVPHLNLLIVDEVQNLDEDKGRYARFIEKAMNKNPKLKVVGVTATPFRARGVIYGKGKLFERICYQKSIQEMIAMGFLSPPILRSSKNEFDVSRLRTRAGEYVQEDVDALVKNVEIVREQVIDALSRVGDRKAVVWACANIDHCNRVADVLMSLSERVTTVHSKLQTGTRQANLSSFMTGQTRHLSFVTILSEGFDHPPIDAVILMRPTRSPVLYVQTVGRGLRIFPGKENCLVLDYGQVIKTLGALDDPCITEKGPASELKSCPECLTFSPYGTLICPECNYQFPVFEQVRDDPAKKLDKVAAGDVKLLSEKARPITQILGPAEIAMHEAKSGNLCVRITYMDRNILTRWGGYQGVTEYFVTSSPWAMERLDRRLEAIDATIPKIPFDGYVGVQGTFEVVKTIEKGFDRILSVRKISLESPKALTAKNYLDELDEKNDREEGDITFNFGVNAPAL